jgi:phosphocarrier protein
MSGETSQPRVVQKVVITNAAGLHMRPATAFAELARLFQSSVSVLKDGQRVDGKSPLDMMLLAAEQGSELVVEAAGPDAGNAVQSLVELLVALSVVSESDLPSPRTGEG